MFLNAPAKLNLHLEVVKKREDGYHDIRTVFQLINLYDEMEFILNETEIKLTETPLAIENNLVLKAAHFLREKTNTLKGATILLSKTIPLESGLGGGSSDAAATLIALNKLWETKLNINQLKQIGLELGSDVPFFIHGRNAWAEGRGEIITDLNLPESWYLLAILNTKISTKEAFKDINIYKEKLMTKEDFLIGKSKNSFTRLVKDKFPEIKDTFELLAPIGVPKLTGTGSTIFLSFKKEEEARKALKIYPQGILVKSLDDSPLLQLLE